MKTLELKISTTQIREIIDLTDALSRQTSTLADGLALISAPHTTVALFVSELDDELRSDYMKIAENLFKSSRPFAHIKKNNPNTEAHALSAMFGTSLAIPVVGGALRLGTYQRILLFELDGPKERTVTITHIPG